VDFIGRVVYRAHTYRNVVNAVNILFKSIHFVILVLVVLVHSELRREVRVVNLLLLIVVLLHFSIVTFSCVVFAIGSITALNLGLFVPKN